MERILENFSPQFNNLVAKSPTLVAGIKRVRRLGYRIVNTGRKCDGSAFIESKIIHSGGCKMMCKLYTLAHEIGHVINSRDKTLKKASPHRTTFKKFLRAASADEALAIKYAIVCLEEACPGRRGLSNYCNADWEPLARTGRYRELLRRIKEATVIDGNKTLTVEEYWADDYEKERANLKKKREAKSRNKNQPRRKKS